MKFGRVRAGHYFALIVAAALAYLLPGLMYWRHVHPDVAKCLWGDPECSLTFATYLLTFVTGCAFIAAFQAAWFAYKTFQVGQNTFDVANQTFQLERSAILGVQQCKDTDHLSVADIMLHRDGTYEVRPPTSDEQFAYYELGYEFSSLGRTPAVDVTVVAEIAFAGRLSGTEKFAKEKVKIGLGNIRTDREVHVVVWVAPELLDFASVEWLPKAAMHVLSDEPKTLEFHPMRLQRPDFRGVVSYDRTVAEDGQDDSPVPVVRPQPPPQTPVSSPTVE